MKRYQHILLAIDLQEHDHAAEQAAIELRHTCNARLSLVHAVEHINSYGAAFAYPAVADLETQIFSEAKKLLSECAQRLEVAAADQHLQVGAAKPVIVSIAETIKADLIVVGMHSRHGLQLLLNHTANAVVQAAPCDVLTVRLKD